MNGGQPHFVWFAPSASTARIRGAIVRGARPNEIIGGHPDSPFIPRLPLPLFWHGVRLACCGAVLADGPDGVVPGHHEERGRRRLQRALQPLHLRRRLSLRGTMGTAKVEERESSILCQCRTRLHRSTRNFAPTRIARKTLHTHTHTHARLRRACAQLDADKRHAAGGRGSGGRGVET